MPFRLALVRDATPELFVVAVPTVPPFSLNVMLFPLTPFPPDVSVADRFTVPP